MGERNFLIDGVSCTGKTAVCDELLRRGHHAIHGDRELSYQGDPRTGEPVSGRRHEHHIWHVDRVKAAIATRDAVTFFCGGARNQSKFLHSFDGVLILQVDLATLRRRLATRSPGEWGATPSQRELVLRQHQSKEGLPAAGVVIDAARPLARVVDDVVRFVVRFVERH